MIAVVVCAFFGGWAVRTRVAVPPRLLALADRWVLTIALPAMVVSTMARIEVGTELAVPVAAAWGAMATCALAVVLVARIAGWMPSTTGALLLVAVLGNTSFLGLGMVEGLLGRDHLAAGVAYDQPGTFLALATWGAFVASRFGSGETGWRPVVHRLVRFAPFVALVVSVPVRLIEVPSWVWTALETVATTVAPMAMVAVGLRFVPRWRTDRVGVVATGLAVKMLLAPLVVGVVAAVTGNWGETAWSAATLQASTPPMVSAGLVAIAAGLDEEATAMLVGFGTLLAFAWMPVVSLLV